MLPSLSQVYLLFLNEIDITVKPCLMPTSLQRPLFFCPGRQKTLSTMATSLQRPLSMATGPNVAIVERFNCTCKNQRFRSAGKWKQPLFLQHCALHKFHMIEGQNTHDQIPSYAFHSFLVEVQTNPTHA